MPTGSRCRSHIPNATGTIVIAKTRATTAGMMASPTCPASNQLEGRARNSGTVTIAPMLLIAVIVTDRAVSPRERWVSIVGHHSPGRGAEQDQAHRQLRREAEDARRRQCQ